MRRLALVPLALIAACPALATEPLAPAHVVAETFCAARIAGDMSLVEPYLSDELRSAIAAATVASDEIQRGAPDEKPPLGDGVPWASYPDVVPHCAVDYAAAEATPGMVPVTYSFDDAPDAGWTDTLVFIEAGNHWRLDDVQYMDTGSLLEVLANIAMFKDLAAND